jgi:hypothetical protein
LVGARDGAGIEQVLEDVTDDDARAVDAGRFVRALLLRGGNGVSRQGP